MLQNAKKNATLLENEKNSAEIREILNNHPPKTSKNPFKQGLSWLCQLPYNLPFYLAEADNAISYFINQPHHLTPEEENHINNDHLSCNLISSLNPKILVEEEKDSFNPKNFKNLNRKIQHVKIFERQGLKNLGNTCYSNALFQCLFDVEKFQNAIFQEMNQGQRPLTSPYIFFIFSNL